MKVYILIEQCFEPCNENYITILGVYKTEEDAKAKQKQTIEGNINNFDFVLDTQTENRIFFLSQENWDNYIEYSIHEQEIL